MLFDSPLFSVLLAMVATFLFLSLFVQLIQEIYKYLTSSKSRAYKNALIDFLGPYVNQLLKPGTIPDLEIRGPFQIFKRQPKGKLLPLNKADLVKAMERTAPELHQRTLEVIQLEIQLQEGQEKAPSQNWIAFINELAGLEEGTSGYWIALEIRRFLEKPGHQFPKKEDGAKGSINFPTSIDATNLLISFRHQFLPHLRRVEELYPGFEKNFEYQYRRKNIRLTFTIGLILALLINVPFDEVYRRASLITTSEAISLADRALSLYAEFEAQPSSDPTQSNLQVVPDTTAFNQLKIAQRAIGMVAERKGSVNYLIDWSFIKNLWQKGWIAILRFLFGCVITSLLITFGAPFWNDLLGTLTRFKKGK
jgi:hypothetical protein